MGALRAALALLLVAAGLAAKDPPQIRPQPAGTYAAKDAHDGVTIAAVPYETEEKSNEVFGKHDPLKVGVLPVYVVITNSTKDALHLDHSVVEFIAANRQRIEPITSYTVSLMLRGKRLPRSIDPRRGTLPRLPRGDDTKIAPELESREFLLKMVPPGETVGGFLFFDTSHRREVLPGSKFYVTGMTWGSTGKEVLYFEISLDDYLKAK